MKKLLSLCLFIACFFEIHAQFPGYSRFYDMNNAGIHSQNSIDALFYNPTNQSLYFPLNGAHVSGNNVAYSKLIKADINGNIQAELYDSTSNNAVSYNGLLLSADSQYIYWCGTSISGSIAQLKLIKTDLSLNKIWEKYYPLNDNDGNAAGLRNIGDGKFLLLYKANQSINMLKLDSAGAVYDFYTFTTGSEPSCIINSSGNGGILVSSKDAIFKYDGMITQQWGIQYVTGILRYNAVLQSNETPASFYGVATNLISLKSRGSTIKFDSNGTEIWQKRAYYNAFVFTDFTIPYLDKTGYMDICNTDSNSVAIVGNVIVRELLGQANILKLNKDGNEIWNHLYLLDSFNNQFLTHIITLPDGSLVASGFVDSNAAINKSGWLLRVDTNGCYNPNCTNMASPMADTITLSLGQIPNLKYEIKAYPNPAQNQINIQSQTAFEAGCQLDVLDISGKEMIHSISLYRQQNVSINIKEWANGIYLLKFTINGKFYSQKIIVRH